jgi:hypothetical protein
LLSYLPDRHRSLKLACAIAIGRVTKRRKKSSEQQRTITSNLNRVDLRTADYDYLLKQVGDLIDGEIMWKGRTAQWPMKLGQQLNFSIENKAWVARDQDGGIIHEE